MSYKTGQTYFYYLKGRNIELYQRSDYGRTDTLGSYKIRLPDDSSGTYFIYPDEDITDGLRIEYTSLETPFIAEALEDMQVFADGSDISFSGSIITGIGTSDGFASGDKIRVVGSTSNDGDYTSTDAVNFTVVGTDAFGSTISEVIALNVNDGEVHGSTAFHSITTITTDLVLQAEGVKIGTYQVGDRIEAKGMLSLSNANNSPIKIEAVGKDHTTLIAENGATNTILDKLGLQNQSQLKAFYDTTWV